MPWLQTKAALAQDVSQSSISIKISQGINVEASSLNQQPIKVEWIEDTAVVYLYFLPIDESITVTIASDNLTLIQANPQFTWSNNQFTTDQHMLAFWKKPQLTAKKVPVTPYQSPTLMPEAVKRHSLTDAQATISSDASLDTVELEDSVNGFPDEKLELVSKVYELSNPSALSLVMNIGYTDTVQRVKGLYYFDTEQLVWRQLPTIIDARRQISTSFTTAEHLMVAVLADNQSQQGLASWYDQSRYRSFHYQGGNFAASRDLPKGTKVKVTRVKTGKSIIVTINDWGPEVKTGRLLDLDKKAYQQLAPTGSGEMTINLEVIHDQST